MGGSLELVARFPKRAPVIIKSMGEVFSSAPKKAVKRRRPSSAEAQGLLAPEVLLAQRGEGECVGGVVGQVEMALGRRHRARSIAAARKRRSVLKGPPAEPEVHESSHCLSVAGGPGTHRVT